MIPRQMIIFCGGRGERLRPLTDTCPKPLLPMPNGTYFLDYVIAMGKGWGVRHFILLTGWLGEQIRDAYVEYGPYHAITIDTVETPPQGTALALLSIKDCLDPEFLIANGDTFAQMEKFAIEDYLPGVAIRRIYIDGLNGPEDCGVRKANRKFLSWIDPLETGAKLETVIDRAWPLEVHECHCQGRFIDIGTPKDYERAKRILR